MIGDRTDGDRAVPEPGSGVSQAPPPPTPAPTPPAPTSVGADEATAESCSTEGAPSAAPRISIYAIGEPGRAAEAVVPRLLISPFARPDTICDAGLAGDLVVRAASVRGLACRHYRSERQDEYAVALTADEQWLVACVADGVSSLSRSGAMAQIAARDGCAAIVTSLGTAGASGPPAIGWTDFLRALSWKMVGQDWAAPEGSHDQDLEHAGRALQGATTALYGMVRTGASEDGSHEFHVVSVGDSTAWHLDDSGWTCLTLGKDVASPTIDGAVDSLPSPRPQIQLADGRLQPGSVLLLMSDGVGDPLAAGGAQVERVLGTLWREPPHELDFAAQVGFARRGYDDDRTVIGIWAWPWPTRSAT